MFKATVVDYIRTLEGAQQALDTSPTIEAGTTPRRKRVRAKLKPFAPTLEDVHGAMMRLNGTKGLGCDHLCAAVLQAGGWTAASVVHEIIQMITAHRYIPVAWRGGRLVVLYKGKGSTRDVDSYRGLLVTDHIAKILTSLLQTHLESAYISQVGDSQCGAVPGRGTSIASLALRCFHDAARMLALSTFTLFLDLSEAFDYAIREVVLGWLEGAPEGADEQTKYFTSLGLTCDSAAALVNFISVNGHVLKQLGANPVAEALARSLHTAAWFQLPADTHLLVTRTGGRQGCKLGAVLFNMVYSVALRRVTAALAERGMVTRITTSGAGPF